MGYDCVMIPGASKLAAGIITPAPNSICGNSKGLVVKATGMISTTVCSKYYPFRMGSAEGSGESGEVHGKVQVHVKADTKTVVTFIAEYKTWHLTLRNS